MDSISARQLNSLYYDYKKLNDEKKKSILSSHWIHTDGSLSKKSPLGRFLYKWGVTRWFYSKIFKIDLNQTIKNISDLAHNTMNDIEDQIKNSCKILKRYVTKINTQPRKESLLEELLYIRKIAGCCFQKLPNEIIHQIIASHLPDDALVNFSLTVKQQHILLKNELNQRKSEAITRIVESNLIKLKPHLHKCGNCAEMMGPYHRGKFLFDLKGNVVKLIAHDVGAITFQQQTQCIPKHFGIVIRNSSKTIKKVIVEQPSKFTESNQSNERVDQVFNQMMEYLNQFALSVASDNDSFYYHPWITQFTNS